MSRISSREEALFGDALALPPAERGAFLAKACGANVDLLAHLVALVAAHEGPETLTPPNLSSPVMSDGSLAKAEEKPGDAIGRYKLLQKIGEGGCGVVWMAEQEEPVRRRVALKVIKLGMDTKAVVARFEAERQALAMMDHSNIAKVHDAGSTDTGRPFFVMELVRGIPITKYCDENHLTPKDRLELFIKVCQAIQHAHQKGVIHRDIKPSNILVTVNDGAPTPKVIDFGIAKATQGKLTDATVFTAFEQFIGTPVYMSPEQAEMSSLDIDTRSDIYSLGVLLYELLTGRPPFDAKKLAQAGVDQIRQQIREMEPPRPSAQLRTLTDEEQTTIARLRATAPAQLSLILRGDLDWIVMRCIEKDRTRRYDTANGLAIDIQRYLRNEPVVARPPSTAYLLQKLIRRHRVGFAAMGGIAVVVIIGAVVSAWLAVRATRAEHQQARLREAADRSRDEQSVLRARAEVGERDAQQTAAALRRLAYVSEMNLAQQALTDGNLAKARMLLDKYRPRPGEEDIRGFEWRYLWGEARSREAARLGEYSGQFGGVAISPDGLLLATRGTAGVEVRDFPSGSVRRTLALPGGAMVVCFSPDARRLFAAGVNVPLRCWSTETWMEQSLPAKPRTPFAFVGDGQSVVSCDGPELVHWELQSGVKRTLATNMVRAYLHRNTNQFVVVTADGTRVFAIDGRKGNTVRCWNLITGTELPPLIQNFPSMLTCLAVSAQGVLAVADQDAGVRLYDVETRKLIRGLAGHHAWMTRLEFSSDGSVLATASADQTVHLHDVASGGSLRRLVGHEGEVWAIAFSPNGKQLVSASRYDGTIRLWNVVDRTRKPAELPAAGAVRFLDAGQWLACWNDNGELIRFNVRTGEALPMHPNRRPLDFPFEVLGSQASPDLSTAASLDNGKVIIWRSSTGRRERTLAHAEGSITLMAFSPDGAFLVTAGNNTDIRLWRTDDWTSRQLAARVQGTAGYFMTYSPSGRYLAVTIAGTGRIFDFTADGAPIEIAGMGNMALAFSSDESKIAAGSTTNFIGIWDISQRKEIATLRGHMAGLFGLDFSSDGRTLASCGNDNFVRLWSLDPLTEIMKLPGASATSALTRFSADGTCLVASTSGDRVQLWHAPSWEEIAAAENSEAAKNR